MVLDIELEDYNLPNIYKRNGKKCFLDLIRKKLILKTPEEIIRQKIIKFLIQRMNVPEAMIAVEIPMSYYKKEAKGRADIIVSAVNDKKESVPILIVECKATSVPLTDDVFEQVARYNNIVEADTVIVTNGNKFIINTLDPEVDRYRELKELPTYKELVNRNNLNFVDKKDASWQRPDFRAYDNPEVYGEFMVYGAIGIKTDEEFIPFIINLMGLFLDETTSIEPQVLSEVSIVKDGGVRYTSFSNSAGGSWPGLYRYLIVEEDQGSNQIISLSIFSNSGCKDHQKYENRKPKSVLVVAIDDFEKSHNSLQLNLNRFTSINSDILTFFHNGALTVGNLGRVKNKEVINFVRQRAPELVDDNDRVYLGKLDNSQEFDWQQEQIKSFIGKIIKYALVRDEFRAKKQTSN